MVGSVGGLFYGVLLLLASTGLSWNAAEARGRSGFGWACVGLAVTGLLVWAGVELLLGLPEHASDARYILSVAAVVVLPVGGILGVIALVRYLPEVLPTVEDRIGVYLMSSANEEGAEGALLVQDQAVVFEADGRAPERLPLDGIVELAADGECLRVRTESSAMTFLVRDRDRLARMRRAEAVRRRIEERRAPLPGARARFKDEAPADRPDS